MQSRAQWHRAVKHCAMKAAATANGKRDIVALMAADQPLYQTMYLLDPARLNKGHAMRCPVGCAVGCNGLRAHGWSMLLLVMLFFSEVLQPAESFVTLQKVQVDRCLIGAPPPLKERSGNLGNPLQHECNIWF